MLTKPFDLGKRKLPSAIFYAPLAGCSDYPFRQMSARYQPGLMYCEMVKMDPLVRGDATTLRMLDYHESMRPIGAQICGSNVKLAAQAARRVQEMGFDVIDLNCGCPVDKVTKDGSGSGMLKNPQLIGDILSEMRAAVSLPVTVKIRAGWDEQSINAVEITQIAEQAGAEAICIHGRTRQQAYRGPANWDYIKACKEASKHIKVIGNGDLFDVDAVVRMVEHTGCDAVLISRGTMGSPWIVEDVRQYLLHGIRVQRTAEDFRRALYDHFEYIVAYQPERKAVLDLRRIGCWYITQAAGARAFRDKISRVSSIEEARSLIEHFVG